MHATKLRSSTGTHTAHDTSSTYPLPSKSTLSFSPDRGTVIARRADASLRASTRQRASRPHLEFPERSDSGLNRAIRAFQAIFEGPSAPDAPLRNSQRLQLRRGNRGSWDHDSDLVSARRTGTIAILARCSKRPMVAKSSLASGSSPARDDFARASP